MAYVWGTSTVILGAGTELTLDPDRRCLVTPLAVEGWGVEMDLVSTGAAVALAGAPAGLRPRRPGGRGGRRRDAPATAACPSPCRSSAWASRARSGTTTCAARLVGLDLSHGPADVARAVLDGIILESRRCLSRLHDLGLPAGEVRVAWRGADPWFCRRLADATGRAVLVGDPAETSSAAGAARLAAIAAGVEPAARGFRRRAL